MREEKRREERRGEERGGEGRGEERRGGEDGLGRVFLTFFLRTIPCDRTICPQSKNRKSPGKEVEFIGLC